MKQTKFAGSDFKAVKPFGGTLLKKAANRTARPLCTRRSMHLVLRSTQAKGLWSFNLPANRKIVHQVLERMGKKFGVKIYRIAHAGNHLHLIIKLHNRFCYPGFIRAITGALALKITGANKFKGLKRRFWDCRPFTRIVEWGKAFVLACDYTLLNELEGLGALPYIKGRLKNIDLYPFGRDTS